MKTYLIRTIVLVLNAYAISVHAHHGVNSQFDQSKNVSVTGVITNIRFVNPHSYVYFDVTNKTGSVDAWRCELPPNSMLKRNGWSTDMFKTGSTITIDGLPARREDFGCLAETLTFEDGRVAEHMDVIKKNETVVVASASLADGTPNFNGNWLAERRERPVGEAGMGGMGGMGGMAGGAMGGSPRGPSYSQTELGVNANKGFKRADNPRFNCQATNIFHDWLFNENVNIIEQKSDKIVMTYGFMDIVRTIHLDLGSHPKDITPSRAGHSIGKWDGDTLVVDTIGFLSGYLHGMSGVMHGEELHVVEHISLSNDGKKLNRDYTITDSEFLKESFQGNDSVTLTAHAFEPYDCEDLTEEITEGF